MKHFKIFISASLMLCVCTFVSFAQSDMEKLSATKPASNSAVTTTTAVKKPVEKYFNIILLDELRSSTNNALVKWQTSSRGGVDTREAFINERQRYLAELNNTLSSHVNSAVEQKVRAEIKRISEIK